MSIQFNLLQKIFTKCYENTKLSSSKTYAKIMKDLSHNTLLIADLELGKEELNLICDFLKRNEIRKTLETLIISQRSTVGKAHNRRCHDYADGNTSALALNNNQLFKNILTFIAHSKCLHCVIIDSITISIPLIQTLTKALTVTKSELRWFGIKGCKLGDDGLNILSSVLCKSHLQVIALEQCDLTDESCQCIGNILKNHENKIDSIYWNATLRKSETNKNYMLEEMKNVQACGLLAISLSGNKFTGAKLYHITKAVRNNFWLLGINLSSNEIKNEELEIFIKSLKSNEAIHAILLNNNPGYKYNQSNEIIEIINKNISRFDNLPNYISNLLNKWIDSLLYQHQLFEIDKYNEELDQLTIPKDITNNAISSPNRYNDNYFDQMNTLNGSIFQSKEMDKPFVRKIYNDIDSITDRDDDYFIDNLTNRLSNNDYEIPLDNAIPSPDSYTKYYHPSISDSLIPNIETTNNHSSPDDRPPSRHSIRPRAKSLSSVLQEKTNNFLPIVLSNDQRSSSPIHIPTITNSDNDSNSLNRVKNLRRKNSESNNYKSNKNITKIDSKLTSKTHSYFNKSLDNAVTKSTNHKLASSVTTAKRSDYNTRNPYKQTNQSITSIVKKKKKKLKDNETNTASISNQQLNHVFNQLTISITTATENLTNISSKLIDLTESLSNSLLLQTSLYQQSHNNSYIHSNNASKLIDKQDVNKIDSNNSYIDKHILNKDDSYISNTSDVMNGMLDHSINSEENSYLISQISNQLKHKLLHIYDTIDN